MDSLSWQCKFNYLYSVFRLNQLNLIKMQPAYLNNANMKLLFCALVFCLVLISSSMSGNINLNDQASIDSYSLNYPAETWDWLFIEGDDITNLNGLSTLTSAGGVHFGDCPNLTSLEGLNNLTSILNSLEFEGNVPLVNFEGLNSLSSVEFWILLSPESSVPIINFQGLESLTHLGSLRILNGPGIQNFMGLEQLVEVDFISFGNAPNFENFNGLSSLSQLPALVTGNLNLINGFEGLENITQLGDLNCQYTQIGSFNGLENASISGIAFDDCTYPTDVPVLQSVTNLLYFDFSNISGVNSLPFIPNLTTVEWFGLHDCPGIENLSGIESVLTMGTFWLLECPSLTNINALNEELEISDGLTIVGTGLSNCSLAPICESIASGLDEIWILNNFGVCSDLEQILQSCGIPFATGNVYADLNCNGAFDDNDIPFEDITILNENNIPVSVTNQFGEYQFPIANNLSQEFHVEAPIGFSSTPQTVVTNDFFEVIPNVDFPLCLMGDLYNVEIYLTPGNSNFVINQTFTCVITISNLGNTPVDVVSELYLDTLEGVSILSAEQGILNGNTLLWEIFDLEPFSSVSYEVTLESNSDSNLFDVAHLFGTVSYIDPNLTDIQPQNNDFHFSAQLIGSYDPNDISVNRPMIDIATDVIPNELIYHIRFKNTGTYYAFDVNVENELSPFLNPATFEMIGSSHNYQISFDEFPVVKWIFDNIMLPDSSMSQEESEGYITYRIRSIENIEVGDTIESTAAIYFDFNDPVITNTASTVVVDCSLLDNFVLSDTTLCEGDEMIASNNSSEITNISWNYCGEEISTESFLNYPIYESCELIANANSEFCSAQALWSITVNQALANFLQSENLLTANEGVMFQWFLNGEILPNENYQTLEITESGFYSVLVTNEQGCSAHSDEVFLNYTGIMNSSLGGILNIYPNPTSGRVLIETIAGDFIRILDCSGKVVFEQSVSSGLITLDLSNWSAGLYNVKSINCTQRLIVQ